MHLQNSELESMTSNTLVHVLILFNVHVLIIWRIISQYPGGKWKTIKYIQIIWGIWEKSHFVKGQMVFYTT